MVTYQKVKNRHQFSMSETDLDVFAQLIYLWRHNPQPIGYNRKPLTSKQTKIIEDIYDLINYAPDYNAQLNTHTGQ